MSSAAENPDPNPKNSRFPLSEEKRRKVIALVRIGSSRRSAAACVGCSPSTITRYAERDPEFGEQLQDAEMFKEFDDDVNDCEEST